MKLFIDSSNVEDIYKYSHIVDGVTTNPSLLSKELISLSKKDEMIKNICDIVARKPVSVEVLSESTDDIIAEARSLSTISENIVIKIPMTYDGIRATKILSDEGIKTNVTLVFSANQALLAAKAGATYVSIFVGRLDDIGVSGIDVVSDTVSIFEKHKINTEVISASIRHPMHVLNVAKVRSDIATVPTNVIGLMFKHDLTDKGINIFKNDWKSLSLFNNEEG